MKMAAGMPWISKPSMWRKATLNSVASYVEAKTLAAPDPPKPGVSNRQQPPSTPQIRN